MPGSKKRDPTDIIEPAGRVAWYIEHLWGGSQSRAAEATGVRQGSLSNVLTGKRQPGQELLMTIAEHPLVNPIWLLAGEGNPLLEDVVAPVMGELALPVARQIFIGMPDENGDRLQDYLLPVPQRLFKLSRYWVSITEGHPLSQDVQLRLGAGDHVLIEPDPNSWPADTRGHPCIVKIGIGKSARLAVGRLQEHALKVRTTDDVAVPEQRFADPDDKGDVKKKRRVRVAAVGIFRCGGFTPDIVTAHPKEFEVTAPYFQPRQRRIDIS